MCVCEITTADIHDSPDLNATIEALSAPCAQVTMIAATSESSFSRSQLAPPVRNADTPGAGRPLKEISLSERKRANKVLLSLLRVNSVKLFEETLVTFPTTLFTTSPMLCKVVSACEVKSS